MERNFSLKGKVIVTAEVGCVGQLLRCYVDVLTLVGKFNNAAHWVDVFSEDLQNVVIGHPDVLLSKKQLLLPEGTRLQIAATITLDFENNGTDVTPTVFRKKTLSVQRPTRKQLKRWRLRTRNFQ